MYYPFLPICTMVFFPCDHLLANTKGCPGSLSCIIFTHFVYGITQFYTTIKIGIKT